MEVILQHDYWKCVFPGETSLLGQDVRHDLLTPGGQGVSVVGVMPPGFVFLSRSVDYLIPLDLRRAAARPQADRFWVAVARLPRGVSLSMAQGRADAFQQNIGPELARRETGWKVRLVPVTQDAVSEFGPAMLLLLGAAALLLPTVFANTGTIQT